MSKMPTENYPQRNHLSKQTKVRLMEMFFFHQVHLARGPSAFVINMEMGRWFSSHCETSPSLLLKLTEVQFPRTIWFSLMKEVSKHAQAPAISSNFPSMKSLFLQDTCLIVMISEK